MLKIYEVGPRDGLQNEKRSVSIDQRLQLIEGLLSAGLDEIEIGAFVRPDRVPQMAGTEELYRDLRLTQLRKQYPTAKFWSLVPNEKGLDRSIEVGADRIAVFTGATETFVNKNIGMSIKESLQIFSKVIRRALENHQQVRGYISVCWVCPYEGEVSPDQVLAIIEQMFEMGIPNISLGDTIGRAHPNATEKLLTRTFKIKPPENFSVHFHDTYGMALANIDRSIRLGIQTIDSSIAGLGGCPYAPGASGNVATEDVYSLLQGYAQDGSSVQKINLEKLMAAAALAQEIVGRTLPSRRLSAYLGSRS
ncbi:MAG TPA: hydroxymethylglutaryl-CoA lyase [Acidobacteriota bacterium]|nr:hydroxymethylglutaryl-CoA lyase [Acidobacteriota bacterium]